MELLHTTLSILCLLNPHMPSNQELNEHLMKHKTTDIEIEISNYKPAHIFDFTNEIVGNGGLKVDFDSAEHIPSSIKTYFLKNAALNKELYLALYCLKNHEKNSSQTIDDLSHKSSEYVEYTLPQLYSDDIVVSSIWSISTDLENKKQKNVLNVFFDSEEELSFWLSNITEPKYGDFFQETFNLTTMKFFNLPFRYFYYLDYHKRSKHGKYRYMLHEEAQQCDLFINKIISPKTNNNKFAWLDNLTYALNQVQLDGLFLEFGVYKGRTIGHIARIRPEKTIHGFDSFEGLKENWNGAKPGLFSTGGKLPKVPSNVRLHKGYFENSIPPFKQTLQEGETIAFLHIDCDLYSSTKDIFKDLGNLIIPGTIIVFDDFLYNTHWLEHEPLAFVEFLRERDDLTFEYISFTGTHRVAIRILQK